MTVPPRTCTFCAGPAAEHRIRLLCHSDPQAPFGMSWYQSDVERTNRATRFSTCGESSASRHLRSPRVRARSSGFNGPFPDASVNPATNPVQMYHLGLWFDSPTDAQNAGCPATVTPFNGEHEAGIQVLNTARISPMRTARCGSSSKAQQTYARVPVALSGSSGTRHCAHLLDQIPEVCARTTPAIGVFEGEAWSRQ